MVDQPDEQRPHHPTHPLPHRASAEDAWAAELEQVFGSTRWEWKRVKIEPPARAKGQPPQASALAFRLRRRALRRQTEVLVRYRGGPECWWELQARGRVFRFPGHMALHDVLCRVYGVST